MKSTTRQTIGLTGLATLLLCSAVLLAGDADRLFSQPGLHPGIAVHIGCGDGRLTAELLSHGMQIVQGLDADPATVETARKEIRRQGKYGPVSVFQSAFTPLPYAVDLINVIVIDDPRRMTQQGLRGSECVRVLAPYGRLFLPREGSEKLVGELASAGMGTSPVPGSDNAWLMGVKPFPADMDQWPHYEHDAGHTCMSRDQRVGPATGFRWIQGHFGRIAFFPIQGALSANGRNFYVQSPEREADPEWTPAHQGAMHILEVRDAFNGLKLWERTIWSDPGRTMDTRRAGPIIAHGDLLFTRVEKNGEVVALDAATGGVLQRYGVKGNPESFYKGFAVIREDRGAWAVLEPDSGDVLRRFRVEETYYESPVLISDDKVVVLETGEGERGSAYAPGKKTSPVDWWNQLQDKPLPARGRLVGFDFETGEELWRQPNVGDGRLFWFDRGLIVTRHGNDMNGFSGSDGRHLWEMPVGTKKGGKTALFHHGDKLWGYGDARWYYSYDPETGKLIQSDRGRWKEFGRCGPDRATGRYLLGMDFSVYDMRYTGTYDCFFARADCGTGYYPANGLYYSYGHVCACGIYQQGILGVSCQPVPDLAELKRQAGPEFIKGPAFAQVSPGEASTADDWPTFRHDALRSVVSPSEAPGAFDVSWRTRLDAPLTAPTAVGDSVFVACRDTHRVLCLDARDGKIRWDYTAGGRVDSPPTWHEGLLLFGCRDGWVSCLNAEDGRLVWKRRAAPVDRFISIRGQLESVWPVYGAVLVDRGQACFAAGRHGDADGGVFFAAVEPATGQVLWQENIRGFPPYRDDPFKRLIEGRKAIPHSGYDEEKLKAVDPDMLSGIGFAFRNDVLVSDGRTVFLNTLGIDIEKRTVTGAPTGAAIFNQSADLLTDSDRTTYKTEWNLVGNAAGPSWRNRRGGKSLVQARLLAVDGDEVVSISKRTLSMGRHRVELPETCYPFSLAACGGKVLVACSADNPEGEPGGELLVYDRENGDPPVRIGTGVVPAFDSMAVARSRVYISGTDGSLVCLAEPKVPVPSPEVEVEPGVPEAEPPVSAPSFKTVFSLPEGDARTELLRASGSSLELSADLPSALQDGSIGVLIANGDAGTLQALATRADELKSFNARGGWVMVWGLTPEALDAFNRLVGVEHLIRPYEIERVRLPDDADSLLEGIEDRDLDICTGERFGYGQLFWPDPDAYGYVVDVDDIAPFCTWPEPGHFNSKGAPKSDRWPRNMVNGMWEFWQGTFVMDLRLGATPSWTLALPRRETIREFSIMPGFGYSKLRQVGLGFGPGRDPQVLDLELENTQQDFVLHAEETDTLEITIGDWDPSANQPILGVDNLWIRVERSADFRQKVKPLASIGVLVKYPRGKGGILLNQLRVSDPETIDQRVSEAGDKAVEAAKEDKEKARAAAEKKMSDHLRRQSLQKQKLLKKLLQNLGAGFSG